MKKATSQALLIVLILLLSVISSYAKIPDIVLKQKKAVVTIFVNDKDGKKISSGTGFIIDPKGVIATNYHVVSEWLKVLDNTLIIKMENGAYFPIDDLISFDEDNDIAIFKVEAKELPTIKLIKDAKAKQGDSVVVIGSPLGMETTVSDGIISSIRKKGELIQITAPVSPGSSGSPVFNIKGDVIGVATFLIEGGQNLIRQQSSTGMPVGECRPEIFWYKLMNCGTQIIGALGISNRIPCGMDTKISEADPESWCEGIPYTSMAEDTERHAGGGDRRAEYPGGPYPHDNDHTAKIFSQ
jgi:S1-C subfamily serine protease